MTSWCRNSFRITCPLWRESTGHQWFPFTKGQWCRALMVPADFSGQWLNDNKPRQIGLNHNYNMTFLISPHGCPYSPLKWRSLRSKREPFRVLLPLLRHVAPLSDGKLLSHNAVVKGRCARDAIPWTFHIEVFKCGQDNSDTITRIGDDTVELLDSC